MTTYTRQQYMNREISHREYYGQFVTDSVISTVKQRIGTKAILASTDEHMNDISLGRWDAIIGFSDIGKPSISNTLGVASKLKEAGDCVSPAGLVCILKEAAKQIKEGKFA